MTRIALLDVDGVVADFTGTLLRTLGSSLTPADITEYDIFRLLGDQREQAYAICQDEEFWRRLDVIPGAAEGVEKLRSEGYSVYWVTSPWYTCKGWYLARGAWLKEHFGTPYRHMLPLSEKAMVDGDVFIDDRPDMVVAWWARRGDGVSLLYDQPYNEKIDFVVEFAPTLPRFTWAGYRDAPGIHELWVEGFSRVGRPEAS